MQVGNVQEVTDPLIDQQLQLEREMYLLGADRRELLRNRRIVTRMESLSDYGNALVTMGIDAVIKEIRHHRKRLRDGKAGPQYKYLSPLLCLAPHRMAACGLRAVVDQISAPVNLGALACHVGEMVWIETMLARASRWEMQNHKRVRGRFQQKVQDIKRMKNTELWSPQERAAIGAFLVMTIASKTGLIKVERAQRGLHRITQVKATDECMAFIGKVNETGMALCPFSLPMVAKPKVWTTALDGGYFTDIPGNTLLKDGADFVAEHTTGNEPFIRAANHQQGVAWQVNSWVLEQIEHAWEKSISVGKLMPREGWAVPPYPKHLPDDHPDVTQWKFNARQIHERNDKTKNSRIATAKQLWLARRFVNEPRLHYPMQLDFRGRYYYRPPFLNPQANDIGRALLQFADGKPITDSSQAEWLWVHGANLYGHSKLDWKARLAWAQQNKEGICRSGMDPWQTTAFWTEADDPWQFLAFCRAAYEYVEQRSQYICQLPVVLDCTCSGIQHYSALLRNEQMAELVNLKPSDKPQDIYAHVLQAVLLQLRSDVDIPHARSWLELQPDRSLAKPVVMTLPYSATRQAVFKHCQTWALERTLELYGTDGWCFQRGAIAAMHYMTSILVRETSKIIGPAKHAMSWFKQAGKLAGQHDIPLQWRSPAGLPVRQQYYDYRGVRIPLLYLSPVIRSFNLNHMAHGLNPKRMGNGLSPNVIHSLDSSHMAFATLDAFDHGVTNLGGIHDCFATTPAEMSQVRNSVRNSFAAMYSDDWFTAITSELMAQLPSELHAKLPAMPEVGRLDLNTVCNATYFIT
jgi:DNA-directed RNA polymerase